jgi:molecular chaperone DnaK
VEVTFDIDANGILNVTAKDKATNNEQKITITSSSGLSKDEIDKMARDAESHASEDQKRKDEIDARNKADSTVYQVEKLLKEHRDKISDEDAKAVEEALDNTRKKIAEGSSDDINKAVDALTQASHKLAEAMYKSASSGPGPQGPGAGGQAPGADGAKPAEEKPKDNVVDAEFVDVDDKK